MGIGLMLGLMLPMNFNVPYRAVNLWDFWRRWHITLSRWLRDYVYIPLGGSREGLARYLFATLVTMGLCGLWHGAGWTFVLWGLGHAIGLIVCHFWQRYGPPMPTLVAWAITVSYVVLLFTLVRAPDLASAGHMFAGLADQGGLGGAWPVTALFAILIAGGLALVKVPSFELAMRLQPTWPAALAFVALGHLRAGSGQRPALELHLFPVLEPRGSHCGGSRPSLRSHQPLKSEDRMAHLLSCPKKLASVLVGTALLAFGFWQFTWLEPASATPVVTAELGSHSHASSVESIRYYRRHYPPVYPYYYNPGRPGGWSSYFGFVPYARGNYEIQALQREYPEANYPPSMRYWNPKQFPPVGD